MAMVLALRHLFQPRREAVTIRGGYVYVFRCAWPDNVLYKIGFAASVDRRHEQSKVSNPMVERVIEQCVRQPQKVEKLLHKQFAANPVTKEWFRLSSEDLDLIRRVLKDSPAT